MNIVLIDQNEIGRTLSFDDPRSVHIRTVLNRKTGDSFDCGIIDGPRGIATVDSDSPAGMKITFEPREEPPSLDPVWLLVGLPRPQSARRILVEATTMGIERLLFFRAEKSERSYAQSSMWTDGTVRRLLLTGAEQAFCTRLPEALVLGKLEAALNETSRATSKIALDNYEAASPLGMMPGPKPPALIAIGPERGWSAAERNCLREHKFLLVHLGPRVLRTETACTVAVALTRDRMGLYSTGRGTPSGSGYSAR